MVTTGRTFTARFGGRCAECGDRIEAGLTDIGYVDDDVCCADCVAEAVDADRGPDLGDRCVQCTLHHAGEC